MPNGWKELNNILVRYHAVGIELIPYDKSYIYKAVTMGETSR